MRQLNISRIASYKPTSAAEGNRQAAVLAPIIERSDGDYLLFTKRADHLGQHPGQMSFPGGGREAVDSSLTDTAKREAHEEIGLKPPEVDIVGRLDDIPTISGYSVRPFVGTAPDRSYTPDENEVAEIAILSVQDLTNLNNYHSECRVHPHQANVRIHYFEVDGFTVWGATGRMLAQLLEITTDWEIPPEADKIIDAESEYQR